MTGRHVFEDETGRAGMSPDLTAPIPAVHRDRPVPAWLTSQRVVTVVALLVGALIISWTFARQEQRVNEIAGPVLDRCAVGAADPELCAKAEDVRSDPIVVPPTVVVTETVRVPVPGAPGSPGPVTTVTTTVPAPGRAPVTVTATETVPGPATTRTLPARTLAPVTRTTTRVETDVRTTTETRTVTGEPDPPTTTTVTVTMTEEPPPTVTETETVPPTDDGDGGGLLGGLLGP